jgi:DNA-binding MarR family transcriptional regulator
LAAGKPVVMVCSSEREGRYPFDIQHRSVIRYKVDARSDFELLQSQITAKLKALLEKKQALQQIISADPVAPVAGLSQPEITVLATLAGSVVTPDSWESTYRVKDQAEREYLTSLGFTLALRRLIQKGLIDDGMDRDYRGEEFPALRVANEGWKWIDENESRFVIRKETLPSKDYADMGITDADIPF